VKIVCVTSCFSGIVHTYIAAEAFRRSGETLGHKIFVETQGSAGSGPVAQDLIDSADGVIFAVDLDVNGLDRFAGKPYLRVDVAAAINGSTDLIKQLLGQIGDGTAARVEAARQTESISARSESGQKKKGFFGKLFGKGR
jgi:PTS system fructose-specific IIC component